MSVESLIGQIALDLIRGFLSLSSTTSSPGVVLGTWNIANYELLNATELRNSGCAHVGNRSRMSSCCPRCEDRVSKASR